MSSTLRAPRAAPRLARATCAPRALSSASPPAPPATAVVVGGGVIGLTCAVRLLEQGWGVTVLARERPERTVSIGAGAIWEYPPFKVAPQQKAREWALASRAVFEALPQSTGTRLLRAHYLYASEAAAPAERLAPPYAHLLRDFRSGLAAVPPEVAPAFVTGYSHVAPVVDMTLYLPYLERLVTALGGVLRFGCHLASLDEATKEAAPQRPAVLVNCAALGAAALCGDTALSPVRGVKVYVRCPEVRSVYCVEPRDASPDFTTVIPRARGGEVACSGVAQPGATSQEVTADEVAAILRRCERLLPALKGAPVVGTWAGLRPLRAADAGGVRLEAEQPSAADVPTVIHCYGHGGAGVVTSWGCAADVAQLAAAAAGGARLQRRPLPPDAAGLPPLQLA